MRKLSKLQPLLTNAKWVDKRKRKTVDVPAKLSILDDKLGLNHGLR